MEQEVKVTNWPLGSGNVGITFADLGAAALSYAKWHSLTWAVVHGCLGWLYIVYYLIKYGIR